MSNYDSIPQNIIDRVIQRVAQRHMDTDAWIDTHASGTLRKNKRIGFAWKSQYLEERVCFEFGWTFEVLPNSRVMSGVPFTEGDCHAVTESGWHLDRYMTQCNLFDDHIQPAYLNVEYPDGTTKEGIGMIVTPTDRPAWLPAGHVVFSIIAEYDKANGAWKAAENPC